MPNDKPQTKHYEQAIEEAMNDTIRHGADWIAYRAAELARAEAMRKWQKVADQDDEDACRIANKLSGSNP